MRVKPQVSVYLVIVFAALASIAFRGARMTVSLSALKLGADPVLIGMLAAATVALPSLLAVQAGKASDRYGSRYPLLFGSLGLGLALALPTLWPGISGLFAAVIVLGLANIYFHVCVHYTIGLFGDKLDRARNFSTFSLMGSVAAFIGPALAGFAIDHLGYTASFLLLAALAIVPCLLLIAMPAMLPAHVRHRVDETSGPAPKLLRDAPLRRVVFMSGTVLTGIELFTFYVPIYGRSIGLSASQIGLVLAAHAAAAFVVRLALPRLMQRLGAERLLAWALLASGITYLMFPLFANVLALLLVSFTLGLSLGCGQPLSIMLVYDRAPAGRAGEALGLRLTVNKATQFGVPLIFGSLGSFFGVYPVFWANAVLLAASGVHALRRDTPADARSGTESGRHDGVDSTARGEAFAARGDACASGDASVATGAQSRVDSDAGTERRHEREVAMLPQDDVTDLETSAAEEERALEDPEGRR